MRETCSVRVTARNKILIGGDADCADSMEATYDADHASPEMTINLSWYVGARVEHHPHEPYRVYGGKNFEPEDKGKVLAWHFRSTRCGLDSYVYTIPKFAPSQSKFISLPRRPCRERRSGPNGHTPAWPTSSPLYRQAPISGLRSHAGLRRHQRSERFCFHSTAVVPSFGITSLTGV